MKGRIFFINKMIIVLLTALFLFSLSLNTKTVTSSVNDNTTLEPSIIALTPHDPIFITSDSGFAVFLGTGTDGDPYIIEGFNITTTHDTGIYISGTMKYFIVRNCYVDANNYGIYISKVAGGTTTIINNTCNKNNHGILLEFSGSSTVINNTCDNIRLSHSVSSTVTNNMCNNSNGGISLSYSWNSTVANNTCSNNNWGGISLDYSVSSTVVNNTCNNNRLDGIYLYSSGSSTVSNNTFNNNRWGIWLDYSVSSTVSNNTCNNNKWGIYLYDSAFCVVTYNLLQENERYGVYLGVFLAHYSDNNLIHHNTFLDNNLGGSSQAYNSGKNNTWYDPETKEGNFWSDLGNRCTYKIEGYVHSKDLYPLNRAQSCPNPITMTILSIVLPLIVSVAILAFVVPKYVIPYTRETIIPYFSKRKEKRQDRKAKLLSCPNCGEKIKLSSTLCENCGESLPKRKRFVLNRKGMLLYKIKLEESSDEELKRQLIINIFIAILFVMVTSTEIPMMLWGVFYATLGSSVLLIAGCLFALILILTLFFFIIPRFTALRSEKKTRRRKK